MDVNGHSCQHYAAHFGHKEILDFLKEKKNLFYPSTFDGTTPLHTACRMNQIGLVTNMLESKLMVEVS